MGCALSCLQGYYRKVEWFISGPPVTADNRENGRDILNYSELFVIWKITLKIALIIIFVYLQAKWKIILIIDLKTIA